MAEEGSKMWTWKHYIKINDNEIKCNYCDEIYKTSHIGASYMTIHLRNHGINNSSTTWKDRKNTILLWQYYTKKESYIVKCNICNKLLRLTSAYNIENLSRHLLLKHREKVTMIQKAFADTWLSQHFAFDIKDYRTRCIHCNLKLSIFIGIDGLTDHLKVFHDKNGSLRIKERNIENVYVSPSSRSAWRHCTQLSRNIIKCNYCDKIYKTSRISLNLKEHLCSVHKIINDDDWKSYTSTSLAWQYYTKEKEYTARCKICCKLLKHAYNVAALEFHLLHIHREEIIKIQEMIKRTWLIRYFAFNEYDDKVKCIRCKRELKIFIGISRLKYHLKSCHEGNEGNDVDIMVQQSVNEKDNASTSSHQVELYSQTIDEERQRFYATVQQQQIVKGTESKQVLQSNTTLNNDSYFLNALTFCDSTEHLKSNDEINISTANILMQKSLNEAHNVNSRSNHVGTHSEAIENEDKRFHHETILNQQTAMMISEEILQTDNMSNYDIFAMDELAIGDINEHLHIDVEKINSNLMIQQPLDEENANSFYQADTHLQNAKSGSQWLYNEADQQPVMMISPEQTSQVNDILNNDAFTFDTNKRLKSDVEIDGNIMNQLIQQLLDDNNLSTYFYEPDAYS